MTDERRLSTPDRESRAVEILLVEDNPGDVRLTQEALRAGKVWNRLHHAADGHAALAFLKKEGHYGDAPRPDVILLDLNLPRKDGREVLSEIKSDPLFSTIPVVILTTSKAEEDILKSYGLHANCYIVKPIDFSRFAEVVNAIENFWFCIVKLPPGQSRAA